MFNDSVTIFNRVGGIWYACEVGGVLCTPKMKGERGLCTVHGKVYFVPGRFYSEKTLNTKDGVSDVNECFSLSVHDTLICFGRHSEYLPSPASHSDVHKVTQVMKLKGVSDCKIAIAVL